MKNARLIIAQIELKDGKAPEWILLFKEGWNEIEKTGKFLMDRVAFAVVAEYVARRGNDIVFDYEHQTIKDVKAPAAGWWKEARYVDGVGMQVRVDWTEEAAGYIAKNEYRYFSPVFFVRNSDQRVIAVHSVALTNAPRINHLTPLLAKLGAEIKKEDDDMELLKKLIAKLKLAADAGEDIVLAEVEKLMANPPATKEVVAKEVLTALDLTEGDASVVVASIHALKQSTKGMVSRAEFDKLAGDLALRDATEVVAKAMTDGKITPDQKDWATEYAKRDLAGFKVFATKAPVVIPLDQLPGQKPVIDKTIIDGATATVAKMMGVSAEDIKKYGTA